MSRWTLQRLRDVEQATQKVIACASTLDAAVHDLEAEVTLFGIQSTPSANLKTFASTLAILKLWRRGVNIEPRKVACYLEVAERLLKVARVPLQTSPLSFLYEELGSVRALWIARGGRHDLAAWTHLMGVFRGGPVRADGHWGSLMDLGIRSLRLAHFKRAELAFELAESAAGSEVAWQAARLGKIQCARHQGYRSEAKLLSNLTKWTKENTVAAHWEVACLADDPSVWELRLAEAESLEAWWAARLAWELALPGATADRLDPFHLHPKIPDNGNRAFVRSARILAFLSPTRREPVDLRRIAQALKSSELVSTLDQEVLLLKYAMKRLRAFNRPEFIEIAQSRLVQLHCA